MNLKELKESIDRVYEITRNPEQVTVVIPVHRTGTVGGLPAVSVKSLSSGFDWDNGKFFIWPEETLKQISVDEIEYLKAKYQEYGWKWYEERRKRGTE